MPCRGRERAAALGSEALRAIERAGGMETGQGFLCFPPAPPRSPTRRMALLVRPFTPLFQCSSYIKPCLRRDREAPFFLGQP